MKDKNFHPFGKSPPPVLFRKSLRLVDLPCRFGTREDIFGTWKVNLFQINPVIFRGGSPYGKCFAGRQRYLMVCWKLCVSPKLCFISEVFARNCYDVCSRQPWIWGCCTITLITWGWGIGQDLPLCDINILSLHYWSAEQRLLSNEIFFSCLVTWTRMSSLSFCDTWLGKV